MVVGGPPVPSLVVDESLKHHQQAARPLAQRAVGVLLQEGDELWPHLGQNRRHVVSGQGVAVVQVHHRVLQVAEGERKQTEVSEAKERLNGNRVPSPAGATNSKNRSRSRSQEPNI